MTPDFRPLLGRLGHGLQRLAKGVREFPDGRSLLLSEEGFAHPEIRERPVRLDGKGALILTNGVVEPSLLGKLFATRYCRARTQRNPALQDHVIGIDLDPARLWPSKGFHREARFGADYIHGFLFRISFGIDAQVQRHPEGVQRLLDLSDDAKSLGRPVDNVFQRKLRHARRIQPLREEAPEVWRFLG